MSSNPGDLANRLQRRATPDGGEVYSGELAKRALRSVGARAMTMDNTIIVDDDFDLSNPEDQALYAHERHHQMESGGSDDHAHDTHDAEEVAARAIERMVLHRAEIGEGFGDIMRDVKDGGISRAEEYNSGGGSAVTSGGSDGSAGGDEGNSDDVMGAYNAAIAAGKSHESIVRELTEFVYKSLYAPEKDELARRYGSGLV